MATSGSKSVTVTSWDTLKFSWWENSQSIENNTTTIGWKMELIAGSSGRISSTTSKSWSVTVNGAKYSGTNTVGISNNSTKTLASGTTTISHNDDGTKSFNYSFSQQFSITFSGSSIGTISGSGSGTLDTIARASQPSCITYPNNTQNVGDFGTTIYIHTNKKSSNFRHIVYYSFGSVSWQRIASNVDSNVAWTIPLSLMNEIPNATSGTGKIHVETYNGSTYIGAKHCLFTAAVPTSVKPSCEITVSEGTSYGAYIKGLSTLKVTITPTTAYGSAIASYSTSANGSKYTASSFTTGVLTTVGSNTITATVTDKRGRSGTASITIDVFEPSQPSCITWPQTTQNVGDFGTTIYIHMNSPTDKFTHYVYCSWYNKTVKIAQDVTNNTSWTIPLDFADDIPNGTSGWGTVFVDTYCGSAKIGTKSVRFDATVPDWMKPSISLSVTDVKGYFDIYQKYIKGQSKLKVVITPTLSYSSPIVSYSATANGVRYSAANFETGVLTSSGTMTITATVTDQRGRSGTASVDISIYDYALPQISLFKVKRCVSLTDGTEDINGEFAEITFSSHITALDNKNSAKYTLQYKKTTENEDAYSSVVLTDFSNNYDVNEGVYRFEAYSGSSYDLRLIATDDFDAIPKPTLLSTGTVIEHWRSDGKGMGFGKIGEVENGVDFGYTVRFMGGILQPVLAPNTDLNDVRTPNIYTGENTSNYNYSNLPPYMKTGTFILTVESSGVKGQVKQRYTECRKDDARTFERFYYEESGAWWGDWVCVSDYAGTLLWSGALLMTETETITLSEQIKSQKSGIILVFSAYADDKGQDYDFQDIFVSKYSVAAHSMNVRSFILGSVGFWQIGCKALSISNGQIFGDYRNDDTGTQSGITYNNKGYCLRYVIGV